MRRAILPTPLEASFALDHESFANIQTMAKGGLCHGFAYSPGQAARPPLSYVAAQYPNHSPNPGNLIQGGIAPDLNFPDSRL